MSLENSDDTQGVTGGLCPPGKLRLGLCCLNTVLRNQKPTVFCSRTCNRKNFTVEIAQQKALQNVKDIIKLIQWNQAHNIQCLRLSSEIFPHFNDHETTPYTIDFARPYLKMAGDLANQLGHRIVMHPGQYNQVGAENPAVFQKTIEDLKHHADILDAMGIDDNGVLIVHGGGVYQSKEKTKLRWIEQFQKLPENVKKRLVIENCERNYSTQDCLEIAHKCQIPVVFDFHHYACWSVIYGPQTHFLEKSDGKKGSQGGLCPAQKSIAELMPEIIQTWGNRRLLMHISQQAPDKKIGAHSDYIEQLPQQLFDTIIQYNVAIDLEVEAKMKEQAILRLYQKYPQIWGDSPHRHPLIRVCLNDSNQKGVYGGNPPKKIPLVVKKIPLVVKKIPLVVKKIPLVVKNVQKIPLQLKQIPLQLKA